MLFLYSYKLTPFSFSFLVVVLLYTLYLLMLQTQQYIVKIITLPSVIFFAYYSFFPFTSFVLSLANVLISMCYRLNDTLYTYHLYNVFLNQLRERKKYINNICYSYIITGILCVDLNYCPRITCF